MDELLGNFEFQHRHAAQLNTRANGYCESFNGKLRDECLNGEIFYSLKEAQIVIEQWRVLYNTLRPHSALGYRPPAPAACNPWVPNRNSQPVAVI
jgi:transposase InsO family protein